MNAQRAKDNNSMRHVNFLLALDSGITRETPPLPHNFRKASQQNPVSSTLIPSDRHVIVE